MAENKEHNTFAVVQRGTFQYFMEEGVEISLPYIEAEVGEKYTFSEVLLTSIKGDVMIGTPLVPGAEVVVKVLEQTKTPKKHGFTFKAKSRQRKKYGYRQKVTKVEVVDIKGLKAKDTSKKSKPKKETKIKKAKKSASKKKTATKNAKK